MDEEKIIYEAIEETTTDALVTKNHAIDFSKELVTALHNMGYQIVPIRRAVWK